MKNHGYYLFCVRVICGHCGAKHVFKSSLHLQGEKKMIMWKSYEVRIELAVNEVWLGHIYIDSNYFSSPLSLHIKNIKVILLRGWSKGQVLGILFKCHCFDFL